MTAPMSYKLLVTQPIPQSGRGPLPDGSTRMWSPMTSTLIVGSEEAVLVDPPLTNAQAAEVGDWIESCGHRLTRIYVTHGHGDHWFGAIPLLERFPDAVVNATKGTTAHMAAQNSAEFRSEFWDVVFPNQLPHGEIDVDIVDEDGFELEGMTLLPIDVGHTDTDATTILHVPQIGLVVAGDAVYNGVHLYLAESGGAEGIAAWLAALDVIDSLNPAAVVAGHKKPDAFDNPSQISATRQYLTDARALLESSSTAQEFYDGMLAGHQGRLNPGALWGAAITLLP